MAIAITALDSGSVTTNQAQVTSNAFTPTTGAVLFVVTETAVEGGLTPAIADSGVRTWTQINTLATEPVAGAADLSLNGWWAPVGTGALMTVVIGDAVTTMANQMWSIFEATGADTSAPIVQSDINNANTAVTSIAGTLAAMAAGNVIVHAACHSIGEATDETTDGFTEIHDLTNTSPANGLQTGYKATSDTAPTYSWATGSDAVSLSFEIAAAAAGGSPNLIIGMHAQTAMI